ncbi:MBL fold metallo-hydrolase [Desmospora profundinema]|uniref:Glyoxylase-like metal-dependent hydrolase (Beta-lactamase superfamily II) n=1 Tax=Desmospora profundinema TaxID=1571184 RepID=A0ABU1INX6_9BACL|nr:MBL fold metallo-hydrolase [Desmospora profundinema]MDR6226222.1 glyoxylase-like metal-dependent hydrolase (beta-lactamase superfamily II) [Desmospora profundinema]
MKPTRLFDWGYGVRMIDGYDLDMPGRTGIYVIEGEALTLVETGPAPSVPYIKAGLEELGYSLSDVRHIIVTHIHLDHAGGAGLLLKSCPRSDVVVHPRGQRHLADPSRLVKGAKMVYGEAFNRLFDPVVPVPEEKLTVKSEGDSLDLGGGRRLDFMDSPGHAAHHFSFFDSVSRGWFTGDTAGVRYHHTQDLGFTFYLPSTSPNQFDPDAMKQSMKRMADRSPDRLFFGHFGMSDEPRKVFRKVSAELDHFMAIGREAVAAGEGADGIRKRLVEHYRAALGNRGCGEDHPIWEPLELDLKVCAMGVEWYLLQQKKKA